MIKDIAALPVGVLYGFLMLAFVGVLAVAGLAFYAIKRGIKIKKIKDGVTTEVEIEADPETDKK